ncbi:MAG: hypothetical protein EZS28_001665 [Streblomastix strix]|uniref:Uncharacterized protein n=1 Tax=Streblomastix strix TaxID=222440 RepID=A0A5J4X6I9_9EUKA|nr:MAG: hypothetical protein EZS28_001665 [Streblomastix strix]
MEWLDSLTKAQLQEVLRDASEVVPEISRLVRVKAVEPVNIDKNFFLEKPSLSSAAVPKPTKVDSEKALKYLKRMNIYTLSSAITFLRAIVAASFDATVAGFQPSGEILFSLLDALDTALITKFKYSDPEQLKEIRLELLQLHSVTGEIYYEEEEEDDDEEEEEDANIKADKSGNNSKPSQSSNATEDEDDESEDSFLYLSKKLTSLLGDELPMIPLPPKEYTDHIKETFITASVTSSSTSISNAPHKISALTPKGLGKAISKTSNISQKDQSSQPLVSAKRTSSPATVNNQSSSKLAPVASKAKAKISSSVKK